MFAFIHDLGRKQTLCTLYFFIIAKNRFDAIQNSSTRCLLSSRIVDESKDRVLKIIKYIIAKNRFDVTLVHDLCFRPRSSMKANIMY
uniref:Uncharacterized protein n=1 Tax=Spodoptera exigua multiple nucleopolyhedrovirus TaxID=10454 RepID=A0A6N0CB18_9ABAC|nr:hypothetical protein [Spodoptera exigua multiple nucleopolyhedrovirus]